MSKLIEAILVGITMCLVLMLAYKLIGISLNWGTVGGAIAASYYMGMRGPIV